MLHLIVATHVTSEGLRNLHPKHGHIGGCKWNALEMGNSCPRWLEIARNIVPQNPDIWNNQALFVKVSILKAMILGFTPHMVVCPIQGSNMMQ